MARKEGKRPVADMMFNAFGVEAEPVPETQHDCVPAVAFVGESAAFIRQRD